MVVVIRMKRTGRRNAPCYRISVADSRAPRDGRTLENLGLYDPRAPRVEMRLSLDVERARHWIRHGAQPSHTVNSIFRRQKVYEGLPEAQARDRSGRGKDTATARRRAEAKQGREAAKEQRRQQRRAAKKAAAPAAE
jgi:small subunit ribosomal protein S16